MTEYPALEAENVTVQYGGLLAVESINLALADGESLGIVGPNGAGKSTFFNVLAGAVRPSTGRVYLFGGEITRDPPHRRATKGLSRTFQSVRLYPDETVERNVAISVLTGSGRKCVNESSVHFLANVGLDHKANYLVKELAHGELKRLELARALALSPSVLLLDEVMAGLNPTEVSGLVKLIQDLVLEQGLSMIVVEHLLSAVKDLTNRVSVLDSGNVIADGYPKDVFADGRVVEAYLGSKYHGA